MVNILDYSLADIDEGLCLVDAATGQISFRVNLCGTLYFKDAQALSTRTAIAQCVRIFEDHFSSELLWRSDHKARKVKVVKYPSGGNPRDFLCEDGPLPDYFQLAYSGKTKFDAPDYSVDFFGPATRPGREKVGYFRFTVPLCWWLGNAQIYTQLLKSICTLLPLKYGHCGLFAQQGLLDFDSECILFPITQNYWGVDVECLVPGFDFAGGRIKGAHWISLLSAQTLEILGGESSVTDALAKNGVFHERWGDVLFLQASAEPKTGFRHAPPAYMTVNKILKPARVAEFFINQTFSRKMQPFWLSRFDEFPLDVGNPWPGDIIAKTKLDAYRRSKDDGLNLLVE